MLGTTGLSEKATLEASMIRRDAKLADGAAQWVLISQIEHARISAQLAAHCTGRFGAGEVSDDLRREVLAAIEHHDDGWAEWERSPRLHTDSGKPVSFMELEPREAIDIWTMSVMAAEEYGTLAGWTVAGHFARLLKNSEHARSNEHAAIWRQGIEQARSQALFEWHLEAPKLHTAELAEEALQWLWTFDEVSLWFCCTCPSSEESLQAAGDKQAKPAGQGTPIEMQLRPGGSGVAGATPWRFDAASIEIEAAARIVPAAPYNDADALLAAARPHTLRWQFMAPIDRHLA
jgi:hypothetical protein